jgi:hypothetical protein
VGTGLVGVVAEQEVPHPDHVVGLEPALQRGVAAVLGLGGGQAGDRLDPFQCVVTISGADLDRIGAQMRSDEVGQPAAVAPRIGQIFQYVRLQA